MRMRGTMVQVSRVTSVVLVRGALSYVKSLQGLKYATCVQGDFCGYKVQWLVIHSTVMRLCSQLGQR
jgi:hypothetical protein